MPSTFTPNIQLEEPARGGDVGTWDTPINANMTLLDLVAGAITTVSLNNSPVVLTAAQFKSKQITFNSTLTGSVTITFPTSFTKSYEIQNVCTGSSAFVITLATTATGGQVICCPPGETIDCFNDGTNIKFKNLGRVGSYWDYAGSSNPAWNSGCTRPPYLNCDGSAIPAAYTILPIILGSSLLPNSQGKFRLTLNQSTSSPITSSQGGVAGGTIGSVGGAQVTTLSSIHVPPVKITDPGHTHGTNSVFFTGSGAGTGGAGTAVNTGATINSATTGITAGSSSPTGFSIMPPTYVGGLTLIRAE